MSEFIGVFIIVVVICGGAWIIHELIKDITS